MSVKAALAALVEGVRLDIRRCDELQKLLRHQQHLLARTDSDGLEHLNQALQPALDQLGQSARQRSQLLERLGLDGNEHGMTKLLEKLPEKLARELSPLWQALVQRLGQCKALNERNGSLLAGQQEVLKDVMGQHGLEYGIGY
ncbi:flagellar protein FlgN [Gallaecimonas kandeliae]|uniref:flagella synthesis protein FlgN n=1 Tax=Gallaecimonas kandeliae TaxID=3029055 RepID=UPI0026487B42|nr:flagellar protein FlgN [Gallaecimonas kandeliae]WKE66525.1 flagellar protein FlgN [Gallaecimonas kandeliae]